MQKSTYQVPKDGAKIIIVGAGCFGLSTAYALSQRGKYDIWVYDRQPIPVPDAASTDISKALRMEYGAATHYMNLFLEALPLWHEWNKERAENNLVPVYHQTGLISFAENGTFTQYELDCISQIREAGYSHLIEELDTPEKIIERFPRFEKAVKNGFDIAVYNKEGGWCNSSESIKHIYGKCQKNGVQFVLGENEGSFDSLITTDDSVVTGIKTKDGRVHDADLVIMATGSWTASAIPMHGQVTATGQQLVKFKPPKSFIDIADGKDPVWSANVSVTGYYGFPPTPEGILKIGRHADGYLNPHGTDNVSVPRTTFTNKEDTIPIGALRHFRQFLGRFLPHTEDMDLYETRTCWYSDTIDGEFLVCPHPDYTNLIVATGDSGHGMKFLPNIGMKIRDVVENVSTEYTKKWIWRQPKEENVDILGRDSYTHRDVLNDPNNPKTRMATLEEYKAAKRS